MCTCCIKIALEHLIKHFRYVDYVNHRLEDSVFWCLLMREKLEIFPRLREN